MADVLLQVPAREEEDELTRLERIAQVLKRDVENRDLAEAVEGILAYEGAYRVALLGFERLLWLARTLPAGDVAGDDVRADPVMARVCADLPPSVDRLGRSIESTTTAAFRNGIERLADTSKFLVAAGRACAAPDELARVIVARHTDVQRGKFDRGRRKMPWVEWNAGRLSLTMSRVGGLDFEATGPADIRPHPYRLLAADRLIEAAGMA